MLLQVWAEAINSSRETIRDLHQTNHALNNRIQVAIHVLIHARRDALVADGGINHRDTLVAARNAIFEALGHLEGEDEDGVCSLSEFAMVLNAAGWVRDAMGCDANGIEYRVVSRGRGAVEDARTDAYFRARARFVFRAGHGRGGTDERGRDCETTRTFAR